MRKETDFQEQQPTGLTSGPANKQMPGRNNGNCHKGGYMLNKSTEHLCAFMKNMEGSEKISCPVWLTGCENGVSENCRHN